jgi:ribose 5-phosphate isomerase B
MRIAMANDHAGYALKLEIRQQLETAGHEVIDFGTHDENACDLPDFAYPAALAIGRGEVDRGVFVDGVGYGSAMIANKIHGVYAAVCQDPFCAELARSHSNTNALCLGGKIIGSAIALEIVRVWMSTDYLGAQQGGEKYLRRVNKVVAIDARHLRPLSEIAPAAELQSAAADVSS